MQILQRRWKFRPWTLCGFDYIVDSSLSDKEL